MDDLRVLLIEDDNVTRQEMAELLTKEAFDVIDACDGNRGRVLFESELPDIVITDLRMPGMSGLEVMEIINRTQPEVPVILTTAYGETDVALQAIQLGALDYIKKPIDLDDFMVALGRAKERVKNNRQVKEFPSILIAEDDAVARQSLATVFVKEGLRAVEAENGRQAIETFKKNKIDILLLDIKMPEMDGIAALKKMRALSDDFEAIILTGYGDEMAAIEALRQGAMSFIRKPIDLEEVLALIEKATEKISLRRSLKYRMREVDLAYQIIAQISKKEEILIRLSEGMFHDTKRLASNIVHHLSDGVLLIDREMKVLFQNQGVTDIIPPPPQVFTGDVADRLFSGLGRSIDAGTVLSALHDAFDRDPGEITVVDDGGRSRAIATRVNLTINNLGNEYVLLVIPTGPRPIAS